ncbi:hypothetical protein GCM10014715_78410 [Streptomyces spiralis]|uniref:Uncharacterized protein n=1 Tax=Streptomyces spiralis TaxID=66376 RepID=A0A919AI74_9ACTN|nr:hypothetical protein GCM10014715_78410 [Streptomyces spiralis]
MVETVVLDPPPVIGADLKADLAEAAGREQTLRWMSKRIRRRWNCSGPTARCFSRRSLPLQRGQAQLKLVNPVPKQGDLGFQADFSFCPALDAR